MQTRRQDMVMILLWESVISAHLVSLQAKHSEVISILKAYFSH